MSNADLRPALILANDDKVGKLIFGTLFTLQYGTDVAYTAYEAVDLAKLSRYLFIFADQPSDNSIDSIDFYNALTALNPEYKKRVIFLSDGRDEEFVENVTTLSCEHITKPFKPENIVETLEVLKTKLILIESRLEMRYNWTGECNLNGHKGETIDISAAGIKLLYDGDLMEEGATIPLTIPAMDYNGSAIIKWIYKAGGSNLVGIDLVKFLTINNLKKAVPFAS